MYQEELRAIKRAGLYRSRELYSDELIDLGSNDYLGFAEDEQIFKSAYDRTKRYKTHSPKASQLVNGYHPVHKEFEDYLIKINRFESCLVVGSGFLANLSLIEALPRRGDLLILDSEYHASGILASKLLKCEVKFFSHNDANNLREILKSSSFKRAIVAVEGVYSMGGDLLNREIFDVVDEFNAILIVDEAHSSGVVGDNFLGVFEKFGITLKENYIKMGTLGKAFGSYGAYILASKQIVEFLQNRAKAIIYATAPSIFDIALAHEAMIKLNKDIELFRQKRDESLKIVENIFGVSLKSLLLKIEIGDSKRVIDIKQKLLKKGIFVGAIRPPTVNRAILRVSIRLGVESSVMEYALKEIRGLVSS